MSYAFVHGERRYLFHKGKFTELPDKLKVKDDTVGYLVLVEDDKVKFTKVPVYDCTKLKRFSGTLKVVSKDPPVAIFEGSEAACVLPSPQEPMELGAQYDLVSGKVFKKWDRLAVISSMDDYEVVKYALDTYRDQDMVRQAVVALGKLNMCEEAIKLFSQLEEKFPEESLAAAECYERLGKELEALRIYSYFSEEKYRELEAKLVARANSLMREYEKTGNQKLLLDALSVLPTYDVPAVKLGLHFMTKRNFRESLKHFEEALKRNKSYRNMVMTASVLLELGEGKRALELLDEAQKIRRTAPLAFLRGKAFEVLNSPAHAQREYTYACREGVVEACSKANLLSLTNPSDREFSPEEWLGYVLYGYEIVSVLGKGGMGYVLLAEKNGRRFAMKVMKREYKMDEMLYEVAKMQEISRGSKYVVRILANFIDENWTDYFSSPPAIVMEYMEGGDLRRILVDEEYSSLRHSVRWGEIVALIFSKVAEAVIHMHKQGFVHADIKPSNILFTSQLSRYGEETLELLSTGRVVPKLSDLGSAIRIGMPVVHYTPYYAHPLQRFGGRAEPQMDVYSFTVSLYVSLTNNFPFPEWLERELEEAISSPQKREDALKDFYSVEPRMDYVPQEFRELILEGLRGETTMEVIRRDLVHLARDVYNLPVEQVI